MKLSKTDEKKYPKLYYYLKNDVPKLSHHSKITKALSKYGQIKKPGLYIVLNYGFGPQVRVITLVRACGEFTPNVKSNELRLHKSLVEKFEKSSGDRILLRTLGATILHELVHWGDDQDGIDYPGEEGELFEKHIYNLSQHHCAFYYSSLITKGIVF
ncbi:MAG: hypothetical protein GXO96_03025 [Nitrospirae bacterium]|nr:hypothetical protein [Candidatus Manganitrophaceae bacterium]